MVIHAVISADSDVEDSYAIMSAEVSRSGCFYPRSCSPVRHCLLRAEELLFPGPGAVSRFTKFGKLRSVVVVCTSSRPAKADLTAS